MPTEQEQIEWEAMVVQVLVEDGQPTWYLTSEEARALYWEGRSFLELARGW